MIKNPRFDPLALGQEFDDSPFLQIESIDTGPNTAKPTLNSSIQHLIDRAASFLAQRPRVSFYEEKNVCHENSEFGPETETNLEKGEIHPQFSVEPSTRSLHHRKRRIPHGRRQLGLYTSGEISSRPRTPVTEPFENRTVVTPQWAANIEPEQPKSFHQRDVNINDLSSYDYEHHHQLQELAESRIQAGKDRQFKHPAQAYLAVNPEMGGTASELLKFDHYNCPRNVQIVPDFWPRRSYDTIMMTDEQSRLLEKKIQTVIQGVIPRAEAPKPIPPPPPLFEQHIAQSLVPLPPPPSPASESTSALSRPTHEPRPATRSQPRDPVPPTPDLEARVVLHAGDFWSQDEIDDITDSELF